MDEKFSGMIPLVIFTSLLPVAVGIETGIAIACFVKPLSIDIILAGLLWSSGFTLLSGIFVIFHLGHAERGIKIIHGITHSLLSREVTLSLCYGIFLVASIFFVCRAGTGTHLLILLTLCAIFGISTAFTIGRVYNLPSQITWRGTMPSSIPAIGSLVMALSIAFVLTEISGLQTVFYIMLLLLLVTDALSSLKRLKGLIVLENSQYVLVYPKQEVLAKLCYIIKLILLVCIAVLLIKGYYKISLFFVAECMLLDRIAFYASAAMKTPKAAMAVIKSERMKAALID